MIIRPTSSTTRSGRYNCSIGRVLKKHSYSVSSWSQKWLAVFLVRRTILSQPWEAATAGHASDGGSPGALDKWCYYLCASVCVLPRLYNGARIYFVSGFGDLLVDK
jgi:hypothetical protein